MRVYVVSPYPAVRAGLTAILREQEGWEVAGAGSLATARAAPSEANTTTEPPDVVLADLDERDSVEQFAEMLAALQPRGGVVVLVLPDAQGVRGRPDVSLRMVEDVARVVDEQGIAFGAISRDAPTHEILAALRSVADGLFALDRRLADALVLRPLRGQLSVEERLSGTDEPLTARELEVLQLLAQGLPNKLIASRLHVSEHTAKFHVSSILTKLGAASRTEAVTLAARRGLLIL